MWTDKQRRITCSPSNKGSDFSFKLIHNDVWDLSNIPNIFGA